MSVPALADKTHQVRQYLVKEDWYISAPTRAWIERTPPEEAADVLAEIARDAQPEPHSLAAQMMMGLATFLATSENLTQGFVARRVGTRAALLLADLGDVRCVAPLVRVFEPNTLWQGKYQELVESSLTKYLLQAADEPQLREHAGELRQLAARAWRSSRGDLAPPMVPLLLATCAALHGLGQEEHIAAMRAIAADKARAPNRKRVRDAVAQMLGRA